jgi:hypothetical protein
MFRTSPARKARKCFILRCRLAFVSRKPGPKLSMYCAAVKVDARQDTGRFKVPESAAVQKAFANHASLINEISFVQSVYRQRTPARTSWLAAQSRLGACCQVDGSFRASLPEIQPTPGRATAPMNSDELMSMQVTRSRDSRTESTGGFDVNRSLTEQPLIRRTMTRVEGTPCNVLRPESRIFLSLEARSSILPGCSRLIFPPALRADSSLTWS